MLVENGVLKSFMYDRYTAMVVKTVLRATAAVNRMSINRSPHDQYVYCSRRADLKRSSLRPRGLFVKKWAAGRSIPLPVILFRGPGGYLLENGQVGEL